MGLVNIYFFDTYALVEIYKKNKNYERYKDFAFVICYLNLMEFDYFLLRNNGDRSLFDQLKEFVMQIKDEDLKNANEFRFKYRNKKFSFIDSLGYVIAKRLNIKFLTGDKEFEGFDNVEFVK